MSVAAADWEHKCLRCRKLLTRKNARLHRCVSNDHLYRKKKLETRESRVVRHYTQGVSHA